MVSEGMSADARTNTASAPSVGDGGREAPSSSGRAGVVLGALAAAAASIGLAWWLGGDDPAGFADPPPAAVAAAPRAQPAPIADEAQVRRAYEQFQSVYAEAGMDGLLRSARTCAEALERDPRVLDFCLALDIYASTLPPQDAAQEAWFRGAGGRRLALARVALADAEAAPVRVAAVERLTRIAVPAGAPAAQDPVMPAAVREPPAPAAAKPARAKTPARPALRRGADQAGRSVTPRYRCDTATAAGRAVCTSPALQQRHREMQRAYDRALAAGMDEHLLNRQQARWRRAVNVAGGDATELSRLYKRRIWELTADARARE
jgi:hypothetical protein